MGFLMMLILRTMTWLISGCTDCIFNHKCLINYTNLSPAMTLFIPKVHIRKLLSTFLFIACVVAPPINWMGIAIFIISFWEVYRRINGRKSRFTAPLARRHKTKFPTVYPTIYLPKLQFWIQLSPKRSTYAIQKRDTRTHTNKDTYTHQRSLTIKWLELEITSKRGAVNSEIFARILFSRISLKGIFATIEIRDLGIIYLYQYTTEWFYHFARAFISRNFAYAKFRENKPLAKISEITV